MSGPRHERGHVGTHWRDQQSPQKLVGKWKLFTGATSCSTPNNRHRDTNQNTTSFISLYIICIQQVCQYKSGVLQTFSAAHVLHRRSCSLRVRYGEVLNDTANPQQGLSRRHVVLHTYKRKTLLNQTECGNTASNQNKHIINQNQGLQFSSVKKTIPFLVSQHFRLRASLCPGMANYLLPMSFRPQVRRGVPSRTFLV